MVWIQEVCVCVHWRRECDRSISSRSGDDFPIEALKMCWSIFQRVPGWEKSCVPQECCSRVHTV